MEKNELVFPLDYKLRTKDIAMLTLCSLRTADRLKGCMKKAHGVKRVLYKHYLDYFGEKAL